MSREVDNALRRLEASQEIYDNYVETAENVEKLYKTYEEFHNLLKGQETEVIEVSEFLSADPRYYNIPADYRVLSNAIDVYNRKPIYLSKHEPPGTTIVLLNALYHIFNNWGDWRECNIIIGTDASYRPHGRVEKINDHTFLIILGRYLVSDTFILSAAIYELIFDIRSESQAEISFVEAFSEQNFEKVLPKSVHAFQLPYMIAQILSGDRLRIGARFRDETLQKKLQYAISLQTTMIVFLISHELAHIYFDHFDRDDPNAEIFEHFIRGMMSDDTFYADYEGELNHYFSKVFPRHSSEISADLEALRVAGNVGVDLFNNKYPGLAGAFIFLQLISALDKLNFYRAYGTDVFEHIDKFSFNRNLLAADI
ncbi:MAG: hypothetical protein ABJO52_00285, partial [Nisaea sp.]